MSAAASSRTADRLKGVADLSNVKAVMSGNHSKAEVEALRSSLGVDSDPGALFGVTPPPQLEVGFSESCEQIEQILNWLVYVVKSLDPEDLVVANQGWLVVGKNPSIAPAHGYFGVGEVSDRLAGRPLAGGRLQVEIVTGLLGQCPQRFRGRFLGAQGIVFAKKGEDEQLIGPRLVNRIWGLTGVVHGWNLPIG
jgi:hypothetical protein